MLRKNTDGDFCMVLGRTSKHRRAGSEARDRNGAIPQDGQGTHYLPWLTYVGTPCNQQNSAIYMYQTFKLEFSGAEERSAWLAVVGWFLSHTRASSDLQRGSLFSSSVACEAPGRGIAAFGGKNDGNYMSAQGYSVGSSTEWAQADEIFRNVRCMHRFLDTEYRGSLSPHEKALATSMLYTVRFYIIVQQTRKGLDLWSVVHSHNDDSVIRSTDESSVIYSGPSTSAVGNTDEDSSEILSTGRILTDTFTRLQGTSIRPNCLSSADYAHLLTEALFSIIESKYIEGNDSIVVRLHVSLAAEYKVVARQSNGHYCEFKAHSPSCTNGVTGMKLMWMKQKVKDALGYGRRDGLGSMRQNMNIFPGFGNLSEFGPADFHCRSNGGMTRQKFDRATADGDAYGLLQLLVNRDDDVTPQLKMYDTAKRSAAEDSLLSEDGQLKLITEVATIISSDNTPRRVLQSLKSLFGNLENEIKANFRHMPRSAPPRMEIVEPKVFRGGHGRNMKEWLATSCTEDFQRILNVKARDLLGVAHDIPIRKLHEEFMVTYLKACMVSLGTAISDFGGVSLGALSVLFSCIATTAFMLKGPDAVQPLQIIMKRDALDLLSSARHQGRPTVPLHFLSAKFNNFSQLTDQNDPIMDGQLPVAVLAAFNAAGELSYKSSFHGNAHCSAVRLCLNQICMHINPSSLVATMARLMATCLACSIANSKIDCYIKCTGFKRRGAGPGNIQRVKFEAFYLGNVPQGIETLDRETEMAPQEDSLLRFDLGNGDDCGDVLHILRNTNLEKLEQYAKSGGGADRAPLLSLPEHLSEFVSRLTNDFFSRETGRSECRRNEENVLSAVYGGLMSSLLQFYGSELSPHLFKSIIGTILLDTAAPIALLPSRYSWESRKVEFSPICYSNAAATSCEFAEVIRKGDMAFCEIKNIRRINDMTRQSQSNSGITNKLEAIAYQWTHKLCGHILWHFSKRYKHLETFTNHHFEMKKEGITPQ